MLIDFIFVVAAIATIASFLLELMEIIISKNHVNDREEKNRG